MLPYIHTCSWTPAAWMKTSNPNFRPMRDLDIIDFYTVMHQLQLGHTDLTKILIKVRNWTVVGASMLHLSPLKYLEIDIDCYSEHHWYGTCRAKFKGLGRIWWWLLIYPRQQHINVWMFVLKYLVKSHLLCFRWCWWQPDRRGRNEVCVQTRSEEHHCDLSASSQVRHWVIYRPSTKNIYLNVAQG